MDWRNIDNRLSQHHYGERYPVDTAALWDAIQPHIPTKSPKRRWPIFLLIPAVLLLVGGAYFLGYNNATQHQKGTVAQENGTVNSPPAMLLKDADRISNSSGDIAHTADDHVGTRDFSTSAKTLETVSAITQYEQSIIQNTNTVTSAVIPNQNYHSQTNLADASATDNFILNRASNGTQQSGIGLANNTSLLASQTTGLESRKQQEQIDIVESSTVENLSLSKLYRAIDPLSVELGILPDAPEPVYGRSHYYRRSDSKFYVELTGGVSRVTSGLGLAGPEFQSNSPGNPTNLAEIASELNRRRAAETKLISFTGDLKLGYKFNDNISVQTGLSYVQLAKSSASTLEFSRQVEVDDVLIREITTVDGVMQVFGTATVTENVTQRVNRINRFNQLLLPVSVLYRNTLDKIYYDVEVGGAISLSQNYSGFIHPSDVEEYSITDDVDGLYRDGSNSYLILGGGIGVPFGERIELISRLNYYQHLNEISSADYGIDEKLSFLKLQIGLRHNF